MGIEQDLRRVFGRKPAPADLADRVLARLEQPDVLPITMTTRRSSGVRWLLAIAASTAVTVAAAQYVVHQRTVAEAERVQKDVRVALEITAEKLALVQRRLQAVPR
jgi:hypothetical protein